jgi:hypothetical protein
LFGILFGIPLLLYAWVHRPPDPWIGLLEGTGSSDNPQPALVVVSLTPTQTTPEPEPAAQLPLSFAADRLTLAVPVPADLAIHVRPALPPRPADFPEDPTLTQAIDALLQLEDALGAAADLTRAGATTSL